MPWTTTHLTVSGNRPSKPTPKEREDMQSRFSGKRLIGSPVWIAVREALTGRARTLMNEVKRDREEALLELAAVTLPGAEGTKQIKAVNDLLKRGLQPDELRKITNAVETSQMLIFRYGRVYTVRNLEWELGNR